MIIRKIAKLLYCYIVGNKKNNLTIQQHNKCMSQGGFTLIELMVVISITAVLGTLGIAGFVNYNQTQVLQTSANEVVTMLNLAKSRAQSQIKPSELCLNSESLSGYSVVISTPRKYTLYLRCSISGDKKINEQDKLLPTGLSFGNNSSFFFPVQKGGVETPGQIVISSSDGRTKIITINSLGGVSMQLELTIFPTSTPTSAPFPTSIPIPTSTPTPIPPPFFGIINVYGAVWADTNIDGVKNAGERNITGLSMRIRGPFCTSPSTSGYDSASLTTGEEQNNYWFLNAPLPASCSLSGAGTTYYTVNLTIPTGFQYSGGLSGCLWGGSPVGTTGDAPCTLFARTGNSYTLNFGVSPITYSISGKIFIDANGDGKSNGDSLYTGGAITITKNPASGVYSSPVGTGNYLFINLLPGQYTVTFGGLPSGTDFTYPYSSSLPPYSLIVTVGPNCLSSLPPSTSEASCSSGNVINLNAGVTNNGPTPTPTSTPTPIPPTPTPTPCSANGAACTAGSQCCSTSCYADADGDGYAPTSGTKTCRASSPLAGVDCCDSDSGSYAGASTYHQTTNACGDWDWDCSGNVEKSPTSCVTCSGCQMGGSCGYCSPYGTVWVSGCSTVTTCGAACKRCAIMYSYNNSCTTGGAYLSQDGTYNYCTSGNYGVNYAQLSYYTTIECK